MRLMRPPGGGGGFVTGGDPRIMKVITAFGYSMTMWTVDANGAKGNAAVITKALANAVNGEIVLVHFTEFTPDGLPTLIDRLRTEKKLEPTSVTGSVQPLSVSSAVITAFACWRSCSNAVSCCAIECGALVDGRVVRGEIAGEAGLHRGAHRGEVLVVERADHRRAAVGDGRELALQRPHRLLGVGEILGVAGAGRPRGRAARPGHAARSARASSRSCRLTTRKAAPPRARTTAMPHASARRPSRGASAT